MSSRCGQTYPLNDGISSLVNVTIIHMCFTRIPIQILRSVPIIILASIGIPDS
nr:hypothetical protein Iba_chr09aCG15380 [Ipomoea batatas]